MPLPHFTNIDSHNKNWEPVYKNLFEVDIFLPEIIGDMHPEGTNLLLENCTSVKMPDYPNIDKKEQRFKYSTREFLGFPNTTSQEIKLKFNINQDEHKSMFTFRMMKDWYDLVWNNEDGSSNYKKSMLGEIIVYHHDREGEIIRRVTYHNCQIKHFSMSDDLTWGGGADIEELDTDFIVDWWEDYYF